MASTTFVDGETLIEAAWLNDVNAVVYTPGTSTAADIANVPAGNIAATDVQAALNELDAEKQPLDADLTAIAALTTATYGRSLLTTTDEANFKTTVNLESGVDVQAYSANIPTVAPGTAGNVITSDGTSWTSTAKITNMTAQASTSGSAISFTSIPSWVKRITVMLVGVSTNGSVIPMIQLGDSGGYEATSYVGSAGYIQNASTSVTVAFSTGFYISAGWAAASIIQGIITIQKQDGNTWVVSGALGYSSAAIPTYLGGYKTLSDTLTQVQLITTDTFDAGSINISYE